MNWRVNPAPATPTSSCPSFSRSWCGRCSPDESGPMRHGLSGPGRRSLTRSKLRRIEGWRKIAAVLTKGQGEERCVMRAETLLKPVTVLLALIAAVLLLHPTVTATDEAIAGAERCSKRTAPPRAARRA